MMEAVSSSETSVNHIPVTTVRTWASNKHYLNFYNCIVQFVVLTTPKRVCLFFFLVFRIVLEEELRHWKEEERKRF
jgi:hypothetical protein